MSRSKQETMFRLLASYFCLSSDGEIRYLYEEDTPVKEPELVQYLKDNPDLLTEVK